MKPLTAPECPQSFLEQTHDALRGDRAVLREQEEEEVVEEEEEDCQGGRKEAQIVRHVQLRRGLNSDMSRTCPWAPCPHEYTL